MSETEPRPQQPSAEIVAEDGCVFERLGYKNAEETFVVLARNRTRLSPFTDHLYSPRHLSDFARLASAKGITPWVIRKDGPGGPIIGGMFLTKDLEQPSADVGYWIDRNHEGEGHMSACLKALVEHAFSRPDLQSLTAQIKAGNDPSRAVLRKAGFNSDDSIEAPKPGIEYYRLDKPTNPGAP